MSDKYMNPDGVGALKSYIDEGDAALRSEIEALGEAYMLYDFSQTVNGTLTPVTSDTPISGISTGRVDIDIGAEMAVTWAIASVAKWEVFNEGVRVDAIPMYQFSMEKQRKLRVGYRTSGSTSKPFTKISGALLLKHR